MGVQLPLKGMTFVQDGMLKSFNSGHCGFEGETASETLSAVIPGLQKHFDNGYYVINNLLYINRQNYSPYGGYIVKDTSQLFVPYKLIEK